MSTIPNRYYNSPWIADAARNLASALAPPDPEKTLAAQRDKWQFERAQQMAAMQDESLAKHQGGRDALAHIMLGGQGGPVAHTPGEAAYQAMQNPNDAPAGINPNDLAAVFASDIPISDIESALGTLSPKYKAALGLKEAAAGDAQDLLTRRLASNEAIAGIREHGTDERFNQTDQRIRDLADEQHTFLADQGDKNRQSRLDAAKERSARGASGNYKPINISPAQRDVLRKSIIRWGRGQNVELPLNVVDAATNRALEYYKEGYNNAPDLAVADFFGSDPKVTEGAHHFIGANDPNTLPLRDNQSLSDVLTLLPQIGMPPESANQPAATAPAAPAPGGKKRVRVDAQGNVIGY